MYVQQQLSPIGVLTRSNIDALVYNSIPFIDTPVDNIPFDGIFDVQNFGKRE